MITVIIVITVSLLFYCPAPTSSRVYGSAPGALHHGTKSSLFEFFFPPLRARSNNCFVRFNRFFVYATRSHTHAHVTNNRGHVVNTTRCIIRFIYDLGSVSLGPSPVRLSRSGATMTMTMISMTMVKDPMAGHRISRLYVHGFMDDQYVFQYFLFTLLVLYVLGI